MNTYTILYVLSDVLAMISALVIFNVLFSLFGGEISLSLGGFHQQGGGINSMWMVVPEAIQEEEEGVAF